MKTANWFVEYTYFDPKTEKELSGSINIFHDENEEPNGNILLRPIEAKWKKLKYKGIIESVRLQSAIRI
jgi:hypothetical protein